MRRKLLVLLVLLLAAAVPSFALTAAQILDRVRVNVKDQSTVANRQLFTDATLLNYLNDGQREANNYAWLLQSIASVSLVADTREYDLPSNFLATTRVIFNNTKLEQTSLNKLDADAASWLATTGSPRNYYIYRTTTTVMGFFPKPTSATLGTVTVYYIAQPTEITLTSQSPWSGWNSLTPYHSSLVYYVTYRAYAAIGDTNMADKYQAEWVSAVQLMREGIVKMPDFNPGLTGKRQ